MWYLRGPGFVIMYRNYVFRLFHCLLMSDSIITKCTKKVTKLFVDLAKKGVMNLIYSSNMFRIVSSRLSPRATKHIRAYWSKEEAECPTVFVSMFLVVTDWPWAGQGKNNLCLRTSLVKRFTITGYHGSLRMKGTISCLQMPHAITVNNIWDSLIHHMSTS